MTRKQADVERAMRTKGFQQSESHHHIFIYYSKVGRKTSVKTKTSHGQRELSDDLLGKMAKQIHLSKSDFLDLVDCPLSREAYETKLVKLNLVA